MSYTPSPSSLALRSSISQRLSSLRRTAPRVPFWALAAHRVPTLWTLYRGLLRAAPGENTRWRIRGLFQRYHHLTSPIKTREALQLGHRWLDYLTLAKEGDARKQRAVERFERIFREMKRRSVWRDIYRRELEWIYRMRNRPILTGQFMLPTIYNKVAPRMYRQPLHLSLMIRWRRLARARRLESQRRWMEWASDVTREREFEKRLVQSGDLKARDAIWLHDDWSRTIEEHLKSIQGYYERDRRRALYIFPKPIVDQVLEARRMRIERKTAEAEKLARGEWVTRWKRIRVSKMGRAAVPKRLVGPQEVMVKKGKGRRARTKWVKQKFTNAVHPHRDILHAPLYKREYVNPRRGGPPAHILEGMSEEARREDQILRGRSGGGYVGYLRRMRGWKSGVKGRRGVEDERGPEEDRQLKKAEGEIEKENERRRVLAEKRDKKQGVSTDTTKQE
ncbi:hypothetical protein FS749_005555 [Ceratobasidium sp. UAMH 11750]|nr:hypothetical protein FS749_005555 [Ceratobasidium sp. UAMH 11750]